VQRSVTHQTGGAKDVIMSARSPAAEAAKRRGAPQRDRETDVVCRQVHERTTRPLAADRYIM